MYDNVGAKIKGLSKIFFVFEVIVAIMVGFFLMSIAESFVFLGWIVIIGGSVLAWLSHLLLYGFGELVEKTCVIAQNTRRTMYQEHNVNPSATAISTPLNGNPEKNGVSAEETVKVRETTSTRLSQKDTTTCPLCKFVQPSDRKSCMNCGLTIHPKNT